MNPYQSLSVLLFQALSQKSAFDLACRKQLVSQKKVVEWSSAKSDIRLSTWFLLLQEMGIPVIEIGAAVLAPQTFRAQGKLVTKLQMERKLIGPLLKKIRDEQTLQQTADDLGISAHATYGHWEKGRRSISLTDFLKVVDLLAGRLSIVCEMMGLSSDLEKKNFRSIPSRSQFSEKFFRYPWTPTVYLALVAGKIDALSSQKNLQVLKQIGLSVQEFQLSLKALFDLRLLVLEKNKIKIQKSYFYAPATLDPKVLMNLNLFWLSKAPQLLEVPGYHKIDQCTLSRESLPQISQWIGELREKIRTESQKSKPETVVHFHWQMADLFS